MTAVITVPASLDEQSFEQVIEQIAPLPADAKILVDARHTRWADPFGLAALLTLAQSRAEKPDFAPPEIGDTASYWARANFFRYAEELYNIRGVAPRARVGGESDVLLELTPVSRADDVHAVVERIQSKAAQILTSKLHLESRAVMGFSMSLSEACQNIVEHAGRGGWVMVQAYHWKKRLQRHVVVIAVCDAGMGFRNSLETSRARALADRWDDAIALETGVINGVSRFQDPGRGQGLRGIRGWVQRFKGKFTVRSGSARMVPVPAAWDEDIPRQDTLPFFPGAQLQMIIAEKLPGDE